MVKVMMIPNFFKCPISMELMEDPVTLCTGQTYERLSIQNWFASGNKTCPSTMQVLSSLDIVPNDVLRNLIQEWFAANSRRAVIVDGSKSTRRKENMVDVRKEIPVNSRRGPVKVDGSKCSRRKEIMADGSKCSRRKDIMADGSKCARRKEIMTDVRKEIPANSRRTVIVEGSKCARRKETMTDIRKEIPVNSRRGAVIVDGSKCAQRQETMGDVRKEVLREKPSPAPLQTLALPAAKDANGLMVKFRTLTVLMRNSQTKSKGYNRLMSGSQRI